MSLPIRAADIRLGQNEFIARILTYGREYSEDGITTVYLPASLSTCSEKTMLIFFQHQLSCGIAKFFEDSTGVLAHGKIALNIVGGRLLQLFGKGFLRDICPTMLEHSVTRIVNGQAQRVVHRAEPLSLNFVIYPVLAGSAVLRMGPVNFKLSDWDNRYLAGNAFTRAEMHRESQDITNKWARESQNLNSNGANYEQWMRTLETF